MPGFPIRTSSDQRSVDSSPRLIAASYVLHRLPVPRHPPCALKHLQHKKPIIRRKIAHRTHTDTHATPTRRPAPHHLRARCSQPLSTNQTPHPTTKAGQQHASHHTQWPGNNGPVVSGPNSVSGSPSKQRFPHRFSTFVVHQAGATTALQLLTAHTLPNGECLSWCSLERR